MYICDKLERIDCGWCPLNGHGDCKFDSLEQAILELEETRDQINFILEKLKCK